ncbi:uncharacterized protein LOC105830146 [Monomorium pharaonis]|uniref:uncharacterized protein LOC105830146 n=1 Tax=Monomorium pharaonis TaxID=307658 RepID=UPI00063F9F74|nr:uncharacterized protein LOC105830146 [Monomorium pharaonis]
MKGLVLCVGILMLVFQSSNSMKLKQTLRNAHENPEDDIAICRNETGFVNDDWYKPEEIKNNIYTESANAERTRKIGCLFACVLKKQNLVEGTNIKEDEFDTWLNDIIADDPERIGRNFVRKCTKENRNINEICEKCFSIYACTMKKVLAHNEQHEQHEQNKTEEAVETLTEETKAK